MVRITFFFNLAPGTGGVSVTNLVILIIVIIRMMRQFAFLSAKVT
jgi:hypothetical protein